jgi:hypothetical protein
MAGDERKTQALLDAVKKARAEFEVRQDEVQVAKDAYYRAVRRLHESGMPLREVADALGLSHQRVHQMIAESQDVRKARLARRARRAAGAAGALLIAVGLVVGAWVWFGFDGDDVRPRSTASERLAESPAPQHERVDLHTRFEELQRVHRRLSRAIEGDDVVIEVSGPGMSLQKAARRALEEAYSSLRR